MKYMTTALVWLFTVPCIAEETAETPRQLEVFNEAQPLERVHPKFPFSMAKVGKEGWVRISFVIDEQGKVVDPIIHDSSGSKSFEKATIAAVKQWQYSPATVNGKPVEQCDSKVQFDFKLSGDRKGVSERFLKSYRKLKNAIVENRLEDAKNHFERLSDKPHWNFAEGVHFSVVAAMYFDAIGDEKALQNEITNIVNNGRVYLKPDGYLNFLLMKYNHQIQNNRFASAKETAEIALEHFPDHAITEAVKKNHEQVNKLIDENVAIIVKGKIVSDKSWSHKLLRNQFEISSEGQALDRIEVRCDNKRSSFGNVQYQRVFIPENWGQCMVYVDAPLDTEISLVETVSS